MKKRFVWLMIMMAGVVNAGALDLNESVNYAIKNNPTVLASQKKAAAAGAKLSQAVSAFFPTVNLSGDYDKAYSQPSTVQITTQSTSGAVTQTLTFGTNATATIRGVQGTLSQPVFVAALFPGYGIAKKGADSATEQYRQTVIDTTFNVTQTYFGVIKAKDLEKLMSDSLDMARSHREQVQSMYNAGVATKADLLRSKVREANAQVALTKAKYGVYLAKDAFNNALGNDLRQPVDIKDEGFSGQVANIPTDVELISLAYANRPDWKGFLLATGISEDNLSLSKSEYLPTVMLNANKGNQITEYPTFQSDVNSWRVTGAGSWKLFDGLGRENRIREAADNLSAQQASVEQVKNNIALEVRDCYFNLKSALDTIGSTKQAVDSAVESYKVTTSRYDSGVGTNTDVLDSQVDLTQAKNAYLQALFDVEIAKAKINKAVGKVVL